MFFGKIQSDRQCHSLLLHNSPHPHILLLRTKGEIDQVQTFEINSEGGLQPQAEEAAL
jgi:hypothetical protein